MSSTALPSTVSATKPTATRTTGASSEDGVSNRRPDGRASSPAPDAGEAELEASTDPADDDVEGTGEADAGVVLLGVTVGDSCVATAAGGEARGVCGVGDG
jgi:hypothetical protein